MGVSINDVPNEDRADMLARLKRIEGQTRGIQKMIEDGRECTAILDQTASIRAALSALTGVMLESFALHCLANSSDYPSPERAIESMVRTVVRYGK